MKNVNFFHCLLFCNLSLNVTNVNKLLAKFLIKTLYLRIYKSGKINLTLRVFVNFLPIYKNCGIL